MPTFRKPQKTRRSSCRNEIWSAQRGKPAVRILVYSSSPCSHMRNMSGKWGGFLSAAVNGLWADPLPLHKASITVWRWGWLLSAASQHEKDSCLPGSLQPVQDFRNPGSWHLGSWTPGISCSGSWHPAAPPASPIHQEHTSVLSSAGTGQPWTRATSVLNREGSGRPGISHHPFPSTSPPSHHTPYQVSQERSPVPRETPKSLHFMKQPVAFKPLARKGVD